MEVLRNKNSTTNKPSNNTVKGTQGAIIPTGANNTQDEEEIKALLDEIDRITPVATPLHPTSAPGEPNPNQGRKGDNACNWNAENILSGISDFGSDFSMDDIEHDTTPAPATDGMSVAVVIPGVISSYDERIKILPFPFTSSSFDPQEYERNAKVIELEQTHGSGSKFTKINQLDEERPNKVEKMLLTMIGCEDCDGDYEITLMDGTGEIRATLEEDALRTLPTNNRDGSVTSNGVTLHFGITFLLSQVSLFRLSLPDGSWGDPHLIITSRNISCVYCNIHTI